MSSPIYIVLVAMAGALLLSFLGAAYAGVRRHKTSAAAHPDEIVPAFLPVDIALILELVDTQEDSWPKNAVGLEQQRRKVQQTIECLRRMKHNAALLQRLGYGQLDSSNEVVSGLAQQMIDAGVQVRMYSFVGLSILHLWNAKLSLVPHIPLLRVSDLRQVLFASLLPAYQLMKDKADNLTSLKFASMNEAVLNGLYS